MFVPDSVPNNQDDSEAPLKKILLWNGASSWGGKCFNLFLLGHNCPPLCLQKFILFIITFLIFFSFLSLLFFLKLSICICPLFLPSQFTSECECRFLLSKCTISDYFKHLFQLITMKKILVTLFQLRLHRIEIVLRGCYLII